MKPQASLDVVAFAASIDKIAVNFPDAAYAVLEHVADAAEESARATTLYRDKGGELRRRTYVQPSGADFELVADTFYAAWVENGRRAVVAGGRSVDVTPGAWAGSGFTVRRRVHTGVKMLRFVVNGQVIFRKRVGPAAPRPFMQAAAQAAVAAVPAIANELLTPLWV